MELYGNLFFVFLKKCQFLFLIQVPTLISRIKRNGLRSMDFVIAIVIDLKIGPEHIQQ